MTQKMNDAAVDYKRFGAFLVRSGDCAFRVGIIGCFMKFNLQGNLMAEAKFNLKGIEAFLEKQSARDTLWNVLAVNSREIIGYHRQPGERLSLNSVTLAGRIHVTPTAGHRLNQLISTAGVDAFVFVKVICGKTEGTLRGKSIFVEPGSVLVVDCSRLAEQKLDSNGDFFYLLVPRIDISDLSVRSNIHGHVIVASAECRVPLKILQDIERDYTNLPWPQLRDLKYAFLAAVFSYFDYTLNAARHHPKTVPERIREYIDLNSHCPELNVEEIAKKFNISRAQLYRHFRDEGGVGQYLLKRRLSRLHENLLNRHLPEKTLKGVAAEYGFRDARALRKAFEKQYGFDLWEALSSLGLMRN